MYEALQQQYTIYNDKMYSIINSKALSRAVYTFIQI